MEPFVAKLIYFVGLWLANFAIRAPDIKVHRRMIIPNYVAGFSGILPFAAFYCLRVRKEERMMAEEFGEEYSHYCQRTCRLIPRLK